MADLSALKAKQDAMAEDITEIKGSLSKISDALTVLARLEERHKNTDDTINRIHSRIDGHDGRIRATENKLAAQMWIERIIWVTVAGGISMLIAGIKGLI